MRPQSDAPSTDRPESTRPEALSVNAPDSAALPEETQQLETIATLRDRIEDMMRLVSDWTWETDAQFMLTATSSRVTEMLGFHPRELIGRNLLSLMDGGSER